MQSNCERCAGVPKGRTHAMQLEFFRGVPLERESIALTLTPEGRPKGEAYVDFPTEDFQKEALGRHKEAMGERYIELFLSTKANMVQVGDPMGLHPAANYRSCGRCSS